MWEQIDNHLKKTFEFENFVKAIEFVNKIVPLAEEMNHHPDIEINYNKVKIKLTTHSEGKVTAKDVELGNKIDSI